MAVLRPFASPGNFLVLFMLLICSTAAQAQIDNVYVYGTVKDYNTNKKLDGITVTVYKDGSEFNSLVTSANGKYEYNLDYGYEYKLSFAKPGMVGKSVSINTRSIPDEQRVGGLAMNIEMTLFEDIPGIDYSLLQQPIGKSKYDPETKMLAWDLEYTEHMRAELARLQREYDAKKKNAVDAAAAFAKLMEEGNAALGAKDFKKAVKSFTDALGLKPGDPIATAKLSNAQLRLTEQAQAQAQEQKYADLIKEADGLFAKKDYEGAKVKYTAASDVKLEEAYPKQKIKECDAFIADLAAKAEAEKQAKALNDKYNAAVAAGDAAFKAAKYDEARAKFNEAAGLKPAEKYPPEQLAAIDKKLAEMAAQAEADKKAAEMEAAYQAVVKAGDAAFNGANYEEAKAKYNEALGMKPKEKYPADQLAAIDKKLAELAAKAEADKKAAELDAQYQAVIAAADAAFTGGLYDEAKAKYNEALSLKTKEKYPTDQLAAIDKKQMELAAQAAAEKKAAELQARYQAIVDEAEGLYAAAKYEEAKAKFQQALEVKPEEDLPKERIVEIDAKLAELARQAEEQRKQAELDAQYSGLIASGDKKFGTKKYAEALKDYTDASQLKPAEQYPKDQLAAINGLLDAKASAQAEKERLERERLRKEEEYSALVKQADKDFKDGQYEVALTGYTGALALKPEEKHPAERIADINALLAQMAVADSALAAQEAAKRASAAELEAQYNAAIAQADLAFNSQAWADARAGYEKALGLKADERYPKDQIKAIEQAITDQLAATEDAAAAAERARLAEEERLRNEAAAADSAQAALASALRDREAQEALDERYAKTILEADQSMAEMAYSTARGLFAQALDIKPEETYPQVKIEQIDKLMAEEERLRQAKEAEQPPIKETPPPVQESFAADNRKEQEAEEFMREAREREEAEKYERIKRLKASVQQQQQDHAAQAQERHDGTARRNQDYVAGSQQLYQGNEEMRAKHAAELAAFQAALAERARELKEQGKVDSESAMAASAAKQKQIGDRVSGYQQAYTGKVEQANQAAQDQAQRMGTFREAGRQRTEAARDQIEATAGLADQRLQQGNSMAAENQKELERQKERWAARQQQLQASAEARREGEVFRIDNIAPNQPRPYSDYNRNDLASQYPQGVTEESYTEGNKVIIRRVVVQGNKGDEYSKVIAKWGTFYFKNGQSISEHIWTVNTEQ